MKTFEEAKRMVENLPRGTKKRIAEITGLSPNTVYRFFNGLKTEYNTVSKIIESLKEIEIVCKKTK
ncbi:hypothetical protein AX766_04225 [Flavobacterium covae]|uniref:hypothetical protein n=1 Tax=Flavobacterium covae TaxID=2906076 RepID=UPI0007C1A388|nr:hypothetical protein [Flavobacterium covae]AND63642.1 hypothetical protein AX766_04075 [Flavobacterium covae]AND63671.1 hypothetical protein AX766_04225 [Flavobacterium covae]